MVQHSQSLNKGEKYKVHRHQNAQIFKQKATTAIPVLLQYGCNFSLEAEQACSLFSQSESWTGRW